MSDNKPFRQDHEKMRKASELPLRGPAATDTLAASSGLELPGRAREDATPERQADRAYAARVPPATAESLERLDREAVKREK